MFKFSFGPAKDGGSSGNPTRSQTVLVNGQSVATVTLRQLPEGCTSPEPERITLILETEYVGGSAAPNAEPQPPKKKGK